MPDMQLPLLTQFMVRGAKDPRIAEPSTNKGNRHVNWDRIRSILGTVIDSSVVSVVDDNDDSSEDVDENDVIRFVFLDCCFG